MKKILIVIIILIALGAAYYYTKDMTPIEDRDQVLSPDDNAEGNTNDIDEEEARRQAVTFSGALEKVDTGCFADGECFVVVDGKHVTTAVGFSRQTVGLIEGVEGFGDLESHIGQEVEVYAMKKDDGTYTLYGHEGFYVRLK